MPQKDLTDKTIGNRCATWPEKAFQAGHLDAVLEQWKRKREGDDDNTSHVSNAPMGYIGTGADFQELIHKNSLHFG